MGIIETFFAVAQKVGLLAILIAIGFLCQKIKFLNEQTNKNLANIIMYFVTPCVIINAFTATEYETEELIRILKNIGIVAAVAFVFHFIMILTVHLLFRFKDENKCKVMRFAAVFSNTGFIALPLAQALIDNETCHEGALYAAVYLAVFNILLWTYGYTLMNGDIKNITPSKIFLNPGIIGVVIGLFLFTSPLYLSFGYTSGIRLPQIIQDALSSMAALNLPLPMLMIGYYLAKADIISAFKDVWLYLCVALRLIIFPFIALVMMLAFNISGNVFLVCVIGAAAPVGTTTTIFAAKFNRDIELSVKLESVSTVLSLITMPIVVSVAQYLM